MNEEIKKMVETYQCPGCVCGSDASCYKKGDGLECKAHVTGTQMMPCIGRIFLGLPKGFCQLGACENTKISIFFSFEDKPGWDYDKLNIPVWKHLDKNGNTLVRGLCPRINYPFLHIFMGDCREKINCLGITQLDIDEMD